MILQTRFRTALLHALLLLGIAAHANNIQVTNTTLVDNTGSTVKVQFDISWENSWRGGGVNNWDAAWVFVKYKQGQGNWQHVYVNPSGHTAPAGSLIEPGLVDPASAYNATSNPVVGLFLRRDADGNGTFTANGVQLLWDYGGLGIAYNDISQVQVFAIEMVYVNEGAFWLGSGGGEAKHFKYASSNNPYQVQSENSIAMNNNMGLWADGAIEQATLPAVFPKGYSAFYSMKYEVTQQGYVDFLNTLTYPQQVTRTTTPPNSPIGTGALDYMNTFRNGVDVQEPGVASSTPATYACNLNGNLTFGEFDDGADLACNHLSWGDLTAYLDWSGIRPMTELEFEKACRGPLLPIPNEYPWGTTGAAVNAYSLSNAGASNESISANYSTTAGNANYAFTNGTADGPFRVGLFAANSSNNGRVSSGASYFGIMELGGNVYERYVSIATANGRAFTGAHGNGALQMDGNPDVMNWPLPTTASGSGCTGGAFPVNTSSQIRVSTRLNADLTDPFRTHYWGGRGVRSAP